MASPMFMPVLLIVLAAGIAAFSVDLIVESARTGGEAIVALGTTVATPGLPQGIWILCGIAAVATLLFAAVIGALRGRRIRRRAARAAAAADARWETRSQQEAGESAKERLLTSRIAQLQRTMDDLLATRDQAIEEMRAAKERTAELDRVASAQRRTLLEMGKIANEQVIRLPEIPGELLRDDRPAVTE